MAKRKKFDHNLRFLVGGIILFFVIILVVVLFSGLSLKLYWDKHGEHIIVDSYEVYLCDGFAGTSYSVFLNDSLLFNEPILSDTTTFTVDRFSNENTLFVVNNATEAVTLFGLGEKGSVYLKNNDGEISAVIKE